MLPARIWGLAGIGGMVLCSALAAQPATAPAADQPGVRPLVQASDLTADDLVELSSDNLARILAQRAKIEQRLRQQFESSPAYRAALTAFRQAQKDHKAARLAVLAEVRSRPEYKAAREEQVRARAQHEATATRPADTAASDQSMQRLFAANAAINRLEGDAIQASEAVTAARDNMLQANENLTLLQQQFEQSFESAPLWQEYEGQLERAQQTLNLARREQARVHAEERADLIEAEQREWERARDAEMLQLARERNLLQWAYLFDLNYCQQPYWGYYGYNPGYFWTPPPIVVAPVPPAAPLPPPAPVTEDPRKPNPPKAAPRGYGVPQAPPARVPVKLRSAPREDHAVPVESGEVKIRGAGITR